MSYVLEGGRVVGDKYKLVRPLAEGGMGQVWVAEHLVTKRRVAIKFLKTGLDERARRRVIREAQSACAIDHPAIVPIHDVIESVEGEPALVMDLLSGESLEERLRRERTLSVEDAARFLVPIAEALSLAHELGIVHRDLKPGNIFITKSEQVKLLDFGIVKKVGHDLTTDSTQTAEGAFVGTPLYMSPEQAVGEATIDRRTDVWSLGLILYECVTGAVPTQAESFAKVLKIVIKGEIRPIEQALPDVPEQLADLSRRMLAHDREDRSISMTEVADALRSLPLALPLARTQRTHPLRPRADTFAQAATLRADSAAVSKTQGRLGMSAVGGLAIATLGGAIAWRVAQRDPDPRSAVESIASAPAAPVAPLATLDDPRSKVGCAVFTASGVEEPSGWLGAAASGLACRRVQWMLGGDGSRVVPAPVLLRFRTGFSEDYGDDPYAPPELVERSRTAALEQADVLLDGTINAAAKGFTVELRMVARDGSVLGRGQATADDIDRSVEDAANVLATSGAFKPAEKTTPEVRRASGIGDPEFGWRAELISPFAALNRDAHCTRLLERNDVDPWVGRRWRASCSPSWKEDSPAEIDRTSSLSLAVSVSLRLGAGGTIADPRGLRAEMEAAAESERNPDARFNLLLATAGLVTTTSKDPSAGHPIYEILARDAPVESAWGGVFSTAVYSPTNTTKRAMERAGHAWAPFESTDWNVQGYDAETPEENLRWVRRSWEFSPRVDWRALEYGRRLLLWGRTQDGRTLAARLARGDRASRAASAYLLLSADGLDGFPGRAVDVALSFFDELEVAGETAGDNRVPLRAVSVALVIGRAREVADAWAKKFASGDPKRLADVTPPSLSAWANVCLRASKDIRLPCVEALWSRYAKHPHTYPSQITYLEGARLAAKGQLREAVKVWRPLVQDRIVSTFLPADLFEEAGESEVAEKLDSNMITFRTNRSVKDFGMEDLRMVRRAAARGQNDVARAGARKLIDAWSGLDVEVPWIAELRDIAADRARP